MEERCVICKKIAPEIIPVSGEHAWIMTRHIEIICPSCFKETGYALRQLEQN